MVTIPSAVVDYFNVGIIIFYLCFLIVGYRKGFLRSVVSMVGTLFSFVVAWRYSVVFSDLFKIWPKALTPFSETLLADTLNEMMNTIAWFFILFIAARLVVMVLEKMMSGLQHLPILRELSGLLGGALGLVNATIWIMVICVLLRMPYFKNGNMLINNSYLDMINTYSTEALHVIGIKTNTNELIDQIYMQAKELDNNDQKALKDWLEGLNITK